MHAIFVNSDTLHRLRDDVICTLQKKCQAGQHWTREWPASQALSVPGCVPSGLPCVCGTDQRRDGACHTSPTFRLVVAKNTVCDSPATGFVRLYRQCACATRIERVTCCQGCCLASQRIRLERDRRTVHNRGRGQGEQRRERRWSSKLKN